MTFDVPALHLLGGDYDLTVADRMVGFSVADTPGAEGIVDLRGTWSSRSRWRRDAGGGARAGARRGERRFAEGPVSLDAAPMDTVSAGRLVEWSIIEPQLDRVYSERRGGGRSPARSSCWSRRCAQYFGEIVAQQNRFNAHRHRAHHAPRGARRASSRPRARGTTSQ